MAKTSAAELQKKMRGVIVVMTTYFDQQGNLNLAKTREQTRYQIENGIVDGYGILVVTGSTGECFAMSAEERKKVFTTVIEEAAGRVPVVVGCNGTNTREVIDLAKTAQEKGADGLMLCPPYYGPPSGEQILHFYKQVCDATDLGLMVYNNVSVAGMDIPLDVLKQLAKYPKIVALKDCTPSMEKFVWTAHALADDLAPLNGNNEMWEPLGTLNGTLGFITLVANFAPSLTKEMWVALEVKDWLKAQKISEMFTSFVQFQLSTDKAVQLVKYIANKLGLPGGCVRSPLVPLNSEEEKIAQQVMKDLGVA